MWPSLSLPLTHPTISTTAKRLYLDRFDTHKSLLQHDSLSSSHHQQMALIKLGHESCVKDEGQRIVKGALISTSATAASRCSCQNSI